MTNWGLKIGIYKHPQVRLNFKNLTYKVFYIVIVKLNTYVIDIL